MYLSSLNFNGMHTPVWTDLKTAKHLKQLQADASRAAEHLRQKPLTWTRRHSDRVVWWNGSIDGRIYVTMTKN